MWLLVILGILPVRPQGAASHRRRRASRGGLHVVVVQLGRAAGKSRALYYFFPRKHRFYGHGGGKGRQQASVPSSPAVGKGLCVAKGRERCLRGSFPLQTGLGLP